MAITAGYFYLSPRFTWGLAFSPATCRRAYLFIIRNSLFNIGYYPFLFVAAVGWALAHRLTFYEAKSYVNAFNPCKSVLIRGSNFCVYSCPFVPTCRDFLAVTGGNRKRKSKNNPENF